TFKERSEPVKRMLKTVRPVHADAAGAKTIGGAACGRGDRDRAGIVEAGIRRFHREAHINVADPAVAGAWSRGGGGPGCGGAGRNAGKIDWHACKHAKVFVEIPTQVGIELEHAIVGVDGSLE